jgi:hypothetical protein
MKVYKSTLSLQTSHIGYMQLMGCNGVFKVGDELIQGCGRTVEVNSMQPTRCECGLVFVLKLVADVWIGQEQQPWTNA